MSLTLSNVVSSSSKSLSLSCKSGEGREDAEEESATGDGAWEVDGRAQALVGPGLATPLHPVL